MYTSRGGARHGTLHSQARASLSCPTAGTACSVAAAGDRARLLLPPLPRQLRAQGAVALDTQLTHAPHRRRSAMGTQSDVHLQPHCFGWPAFRLFTGALQGVRHVSVAAAARSARRHCRLCRLWRRPHAPADTWRRLCRQCHAVGCAGRQLARRAAAQGQHGEECRRDGGAADARRAAGGATGGAPRSVLRPRPRRLWHRLPRCAPPSLSVYHGARLACARALRLWVPPVLPHAP